MRSRFVILLVVCASFACVGSAHLRAAVPNRIVGAVSDATPVAMRGNVHPQVNRAVDEGRLNGATQLTGLSLNFAPSAAQQADLDALLLAQQDPRSSSYHRWLTPAQFGERFGMSTDDLAKVSAWLQAQGFTVERVAPSRNSIHFSGTIDRVEQAFRTELHTLAVDGELHFANTVEPSLPSAFAGAVAGVRGLSDFRPKAHVRASSNLVPYAVGSRKVGLTPFAVDASTGLDYVAPSDFAKIYNVTQVYNAGFNGSASYPIAVVGQSAVYTADLTAFKTAFGLSTSLPTMVLMPNTGSSSVTSTDDLSESELDLEWSGAVAPGAPVYFIYTGSNQNYGVFDALQYAIQSYTVGGKPIPIISVSYGECEPSDTASNYASYETWFKQANAQGQTVISASGDEGAAGCDYVTTAANNYAATKGLAVDYPSSSAYVTGVGGTSFSGDLTSKSTYWSTTNDTYYGNELGLYIPSSTWNNTATTAAATAAQGLSASGGGASALWPKPAWQTGVAGIPADGKRDVPDIALSADPNHDGFLVCINNSCAGGYFNVYGGTSVAAPSFAGILALTEQKLASTQGNLNPSIYAVAANATLYASAFHDITTGSNIVPCVVSATNTGCSGGSMGYSTTVGYDLITGVGAPDAFNFATALSGVPALINTTETLTYSPSAPVTGQTVTFTATVSHTTGTIVPSGRAVFTVDGATTGTTVTLSPTGIAVFTTAFTTGGSHTVSAVYSGDTNYYGSSATATVPVTVAANAANAATTTTLTASPTSVTAGGTLTLTATVSSGVAGTLAGSVTFSANGAILGTATGVPLTVSGNSGTAVLTYTVSLNALPVGTDTITALFGGGGSNTNGGTYSSSSGTATVTVSNPQITLSASPSTLTIASGGTITSTITVTSVGGYAGSVRLATSSISGYTFTPTTVVVSAGGTATSTFSVTGVTASAQSGGASFTRSGGVSSLVLGGGATLAGFFLFGLNGTRRKRVATLFSLGVFTVLAASLGCGSSSSTVGGTKSPVTGTLTIVGTDTATSSITNTTTITVTVQ